MPYPLYYIAILINQLEAFITPGYEAYFTIATRLLRLTCASGL